jgi:hypothetical protein
MTGATIAMDEIGKLISQFESAVRQYASCQPYAKGKWSDIASGIWISLRSATAVRPLSREQNRRHRA